MKYLIMPKKYLTDCIITHCQETSIETARKTLDGNKVLIKIKNIPPRCIEQYEIHDKESALKILQTNAEWSDQKEFPEPVINPQPATP